MKVTHFVIRVAAFCNNRQYVTCNDFPTQVVHLIHFSNLAAHTLGARGLSCAVSGFGQCLYRVGSISAAPLGPVSLTPARLEIEPRK